MTLPFDSSKPETRPVRVVFYTDEDTSEWLEEQARQHDLELSLICHRIVKKARESVAQIEPPRRRASDAA